MGYSINIEIPVKECDAHSLQEKLFAYINNAPFPIPKGRIDIVHVDDELLDHARKTSQG